MATSASSPADIHTTSRARLRFNPAVIIGLGNFGAATLRLLADCLRPTHPALLEGLGWLSLTTAGWIAGPWPGSAPDPIAESAPPFAIAPEPLTHALDHAAGQANLDMLRGVGYEMGDTLDTILVARVDDRFTGQTLWPLLDLVRAHPQPHEHRVTLILTCDSRRFAGPSAPELAQFFEALAERLAADRANPVPGSISWCYLCDALDVESRLLHTSGDIRKTVQSQVELTAGFLTLLVGSRLRRDQAYARTAASKLAREVKAPRDAALVSSFSIGALVLPVDAIAALARDRLALLMHEVTFPSKASVGDREAARRARDRLLATVDLSPQGLRDRLLRDPNGEPIGFDTPPPDLEDLDPQAMLQSLADWRSALQAQWAKEGASPPAQIARNADTLLDELAGGIQREVAGLVETDQRGLHRALAYLDELPQPIEEARAKTAADDSYYRKTTIPSADETFRELGKLVAEKHRRRWKGVILVSLLFAPLTLLLLLLRVRMWPFALGLWLGSSVVAWLLPPLRRRRQLARRQSEFVRAVQLRYPATQERKVRVERRGLFDALLNVVRQERRTLLAWQQTIEAAKAALDAEELPPFRPACGERLLCAPEDYGLPLDDYDEAKLYEITAQYLNLNAQPSWREADPAALLAWLREGAEHALAAWRGTLSVTGSGNPEPFQGIAELAKTVRPQWPLAPSERRHVELNLVGLPERDVFGLPERDDLGHVLVVSTLDHTRLSYAPTRHGLQLKKLSATRPLWESAAELAHLSERGVAHRTFVWRYAPAGGSEQHHIDLALSQPSYQAFRAEPRPERGYWRRLITAPAPELDALADALGSLGRQHDWSSLEQASSVLAFAQQCTKHDSDSHQTAGRGPRYPLETLMDGIGDGDDSVILAAAVLKRLGFDVALLHYPDHCALGVAGAEELPGAFVEHPQTGVRYFYGEITAQGWSLGQVPPEYRETPPDGIEVVQMETE